MKEVKSQILSLCYGVGTVDITQTTVSNCEILGMPAVLHLNNYFFLLKEIHFYIQCLCFLNAKQTN